jgi:hypothetical protein
MSFAVRKLLQVPTAPGICVHQMIGILPDKARDLFNIPDSYEAWTGMAIGYQGDLIMGKTRTQS